MSRVTGRCKPCGVIYHWKGGEHRRVKNAWCPRCHRKLARTAEALLTHVVVAKEQPLFGTYGPPRRPE